jgi:thymidylate synthase
MNIFFLYSGPFGEQIINTISVSGLFTVTGAYELRPETVFTDTPAGSCDDPDYFEDPKKFVPDDLPHDCADLLVVLGLHERLSELVPSIAKRLGVRSVLYPIDDRDMIPGARKTIQDELQMAGIAIEFPEPFCSLARSPDPLIDEFAKSFGRPSLEIEINVRTGSITSVGIQTDTPCGSASCIGKKLIGADTGDEMCLSKFCYDEQHNDEAEHFCLAEMDPRYPLMQEAGDLLKDGVFSACGKPTTKDIMVSIVREEGRIPADELASRVLTSSSATPGRGCVTRRAFDRYLDELIQEGYIAKGPEDNLIVLKK